MQWLSVLHYHLPIYSINRCGDRTLQSSSDPFIPLINGTTYSAHMNVSLFPTLHDHAANSFATTAVFHNKGDATSCGPRFAVIVPNTLGTAMPSNYHKHNYSAIRLMVILAMLRRFLSVTQVPDLRRPSDGVRQKPNAQHHVHQRPDAASLNVLLVVLVQPRPRGTHHLLPTQVRLQMVRDILHLHARQVPQWCRHVASDGGRSDAQSCEGGGRRVELRGAWVRSRIQSKRKEGR